MLMERIKKCEAISREATRLIIFFMSSFKLLVLFLGNGESMAEDLKAAIK